MQLPGRPFPPPVWQRRCWNSSIAIDIIDATFPHAKRKDPELSIYRRYRALGATPPVSRRNGNKFLVTPVEETIRALDTLVQQGKVRYIGCSNWQAWKIAKALGIAEFRNLARFDTLQAYYSIAGRDLEREIVPLLESEKVGLLVWSPLAGGLLSGKFSRTNQKPADSRRTEYDFPIVDKERTWTILDVMAPIAKAHEGVVTLSKEERKKPDLVLTHAAATASRHVCIADALKARCVRAEVRWRWT